MRQLNGHCTCHNTEYFVFKILLNICKFDGLIRLKHQCRLRVALGKFTIKFVSRGACTLYHQSDSNFPSPFKDRIINYIARLFLCLSIKVLIS